MTQAEVELRKKFGAHEWETVKGVVQCRFGCGLKCVDGVWTGAFGLRRDWYCPDNVKIGNREPQADYRMVVESYLTYLEHCNGDLERRLKLADANVKKYRAMVTPELLLRTEQRMTALQGVNMAQLQTIRSVYRMLGEHIPDEEGEWEER